MVRNSHERPLPASAEEVGALLDRLGGPDDVLWPAPTWPPMVLDRPVAVGAAGGHWKIRYRVVDHEPARRVTFAFEPGRGIDGTHVFSVEPAGPGRSLLRHVMEVRLSGQMRLLWPLAVRRLHDAALEDLLDRAEAAVGGSPPPPRWSWWVRTLRVLAAPRARATVVPDTELLATALPRVDWADAHEVRTARGMPTDPRIWADAIFRDVPWAVAAALGLRNALVGLVGIARGDASSFAAVASADDEVLLGIDEQHLDFRASVLVQPRRVVLSTVVRLHGRRGRAYFAIVRRAHPRIVQAMLTRAARRLAARGCRAPRLALTNTPTRADEHPGSR